MENVIRYYHFDSIRKSTIQKHPILSKIINIVGLSRTNDGKQFVAIAEHKKLPYYFVQFHPEASQF